MKIERTKNAGRNMAFGIILKIYQIVLPFIMRTALIYFMGVQYLGLSSLFASVLQVLNLAELGVGSAMVYSMYKPIVEDDKKTICALMRLYRTYYRWIGIVIGVVGLPWLIRNIFTNMFEPKLLKPYLRKMMLYSIVVLISCALTYYVCGLINLSDWGTLILRLFICTIMPNLIFCVAYHNQKFLRESAELLERMLKGKIPVRKILHIK